MNKYLFLFVCLSVFIACNQDPKANKPAVQKQPVKVPLFNQDSAYLYIQNQLDFGPRNPGSKGHVACKDWFVKKFEGYGAKVIAQDFTATYYTGESYPAWNVIAQFNPDHKRRVILSAHWDSRFIAEEDKTRKDQPIPGADDGGSGVGVLIELGRTISQNEIDLGVDIILWDAEDQGKRGSDQITSWCLGSQHWSRNKHSKKYKPLYGINLDMVGSKNPRFGQDQISKQFAGRIQNKVWTLARNMGYSDMFVLDNTGDMVDDHLFVNRIAGIPMINIINQPKGSKSGFMSSWHTHNDDISIINKRTLKVVGQVVTAAIYKESDGTLQ